MAGILCIIANVSLCIFPKAIYQVTILSAPLIYLALACGIGYNYKATLAALVFFFLFVIHAIYLLSRKKHIRMYRYLMIESVKIGSTDEKFFIPILIWAAFLFCTSTNQMEPFMLSSFLLSFLDGFGPSILYEINTKWLSQDCV